MMTRPCPKRWLTLERLEHRLLLSTTSGGMRGVLFEDRNADGIRQSSEPGLAGRMVFIDRDGDRSLDVTEMRTVTAADGSYVFTGLAPGRYLVGQLLPGGWTPTSIAASSSLQASDADRLIRLDRLRGDRRFAGIDGRGTTVAVLDTGITNRHSFFGPDLNGDGLADAIRVQHDFVNGDPRADDRAGHGTHIASLIASRDRVHPGIAPGANLAVLQVLDEGGGGTFAHIEKALQWVLANAARYQIVCVNLSIGDSGSYASPLTLHGIGDELAALIARNIIIVAASGNEYRPGGARGVSYPGADPNVLAAGAVWTSNEGGPWEWDSGARDETTEQDRIVSFSQRGPGLGQLFAPGTLLTGAASDGGSVTLSGTSMASGILSGLVALGQQLARDRIGRTLTAAEILRFLQSTGKPIRDGDDERDNVTNTNATFYRVDALALGEAILALGSITPGPRADTILVTVPLGGIVSRADLGSRRVETSPLRTASTNTQNVPNRTSVAEMLNAVRVTTSSAQGVAVVASTGEGRWQSSPDEQTWQELGMVAPAQTRLPSRNPRLRVVATTGGTTQKMSFRIWNGDGENTVTLPGTTSADLDQQLLFSNG
jgi:subtilisin family serine protease